MAPALRAAAVSSMLATLGACGGGGGGGGGVIAPGPTTNETPLASFSAVAPNQTVVMEGNSAAMTGTAIVVDDELTITSAERSPIDAATVKFSYDGDRNLSAVTVNTPQASFSFDRNTSGHSVSCSGGACTAENATTGVIAIDPSVAGWNYQSFGMWAADLGSSTWKLGVVSAGSPTGGSALPTGGTASFAGIASGFYTDMVGNLYGTTANMRADVNFSSRSILFSTSDTRLLNFNTNARTTDSGLNLGANLSYAQGVNGFSGTVLTDNGLLIGQSAGQFFGPGAEEIGGVYSLQGTSMSRMIGGFGGKR